MLNNREVVGTEGLPNIYISNISVHDSSEQGNNSDTLIKMELMFNNALDEHGQPIFNHASGRNAATITLIYIYNQQVFQALLDSKTEREKRDIIRAQAGFGNLKTEEIALPPLDIRKLSSREVTPTYIRKQFKVDSKKQSCYVMANIKRGQRLGPTTSETVMEANVVSQDSFVFKIRGRNQIWTGPVHEHEGKFMGGSFHTEASHPTLVKVNSPNYKTKDLRRPRTVRAPSNPSRRNQSENNYFSDIKFSQTENGSLNLMFSIDTREMLIKRSKYSSILKSYNEDVFNAVAQQVGVKNISVYFKNKNQSQKEIASSADDGDTVSSVYYYKDSLTDRPVKTSSIQEGQQIYSALEEVVFSTQSNIRTFRCQIREKEVQTVRLEIEIQDPFEKYLNKLLFEAKAANNTVKKYSSMLRKRATFDRSTGRFKERVLADKYDNSLEFWYRPVETYMKINILTRKMNSAQIRQETIKAFEKMAPRSCTPDSIDMFVNEISKTLSLFISKYSLRTRQRGLSNRTGRSAPTARRDTFQKKYNINYKFNKRVLSYLNPADTLGQVPVYTKTQFASAIEVERSKFMNTSNTYSLDTALAPQEAIEGANSKQYESFSFSPTRIYNLSNVMSFSDISLLDEEALSELYRSSVLDSVDLNSLFGKNISVQVYEEEETFSDTSLTLGSTSNFQSETDQFQRQNRRISLPTSVMRNIGRQGNNSDNLFNKLDVTTPKNFLSSKTLKDAERIPLQHKFFSNSDKMGSIFSSTQEFLNNRPLTKDLAFFNIQKVLCNTGYKTDSSGALIIGMPIRKEMNNQQFDNLSEPILCELVNYEDPSLLNRRNSFKNYAKGNTFFVLVPDGYNFQKTIRTLVQPFSTALRSAYEKYISTTIYETRYLRNNINTETNERRSSMPRRRSTTRSPLAARMANQRAEQTSTPQRASREEREAERLSIMAAKTITEDNRTVEEIVSPNPTPQQNRLTTEETDSPAPAQSQRQSRSSTRRSRSTSRSSSRSSGTSTRTRGRRSGY